MDWTALRVKRIDQRLEEARFAIELQARRHVAVLAVALTLGGGALYSGLAGQVAPDVAGAAASIALLAVAVQIKALGTLGRDWKRESQSAAKAMETLMDSQGDSEDDA